MSTVSIVRACERFMSGTTTPGIIVSDTVLQRHRTLISNMRVIAFWIDKDFEAIRPGGAQHLLTNAYNRDFGKTMPGWSQPFSQNLLYGTGSLFLPRGQAWLYLTHSSAFNHHRSSFNMYTSSKCWPYTCASLSKESGAYTPAGICLSLLYLTRFEDGGIYRRACRRDCRRLWLFVCKLSRLGLQIKNTNPNQRNYFGKSSSAVWLDNINDYAGILTKWNIFD